MGLLDEMKLVRKVKAVAQNVVDENKGSEPMWATVRAVDETTGRPTVEVDGGELVECASWANECYVGDRVMVEVRNHQVNQVSNVTNKATSSSGVNVKLETLEDRIEAEVEDVENGLRSSITETAGEIRSEVEETYLSQDDAESTYATKSLVSQTAQNITSQVATTYVNKNDAEQTYATKSSLEQTSTALTAIIDDAVASTTQLWYAKANATAPNKPQTKVTNVNDEPDAWTTVVPTYNIGKKYYFYCYQQELISGSVIWSDVVREKSITDAQSAVEAAQTTADSANALATTFSTYVRMVSGYGLLVTYTGYTVGALVDSDGSFDIVKLTWSDGVPTIGKTMFTMKGPNTLSTTDSGGSIDFYPSNPYHTHIEGYRVSGGEAHIGIHAKRGPNSTYKVDVDLDENGSNSAISLGVYKESGGVFWRGGGIDITKDGVVLDGTVSLDSALPIVSGGTGATTASGALSNLMGSNNVGNTNRPIYWTGSAFSAMGGELAVLYGGTGASNASTARSNLGIFPDVRTGGTDFGSDKSVTSDNTWTRIGSASFAAGTWLIITRFTFKPSTTTDGSERWCAGYVGDLVETNPNVNVLESGYANNTSNYVVFTVISLRTYSSSTTVYAHAKKKGSNQKVTATYRAVRLY